MLSAKERDRRASALAIGAESAVVSIVFTALWVSHGPRSQPDQPKKAVVAPISPQPKRLDARTFGPSLQGHAPSRLLATS